MQGLDDTPGEEGLKACGHRVQEKEDRDVHDILAVQRWAEWQRERLATGVARARPQHTDVVVHEA